MQRFLRRVAVIGGARIPFCRSNTFYADLSNLDLMTGALNALVDRYNLKGQHIDEVVGGAVVTHSKDFNLTREAVLGTRLTASTPGITMMQACGTRLQGGLGSAAKIATGEIECAIAVGSDTTSDAPIVVSKKLAKRLTQAAQQKTFMDKLKVFRGFSPGELAPTAPANRRAAHRPVDGRARRADGAGVGHHPRRAGRASRWKATARRPRPTAPATWTISSRRSPASTATTTSAPTRRVEKLATLKTAFDKTERGTLTAANSTPLTDGAAAVLLASEEWATKHGLPVQAYLTYSQTAANDFVGGDGLLMAPTIAVSKMLERAGLRLQDFDYYEIHEAFAAQVLATLKAWEDPVYCKEVLGRAEPLGSIDRAQAQRARLVDRHRPSVRRDRRAHRGQPRQAAVAAATAAASSPSAPPAAWASPPSSNPRTPPSSTRPRNPSTEAARYATQPRTISNAGRGSAMGKDKSGKAARQLEAARGLARDLAGKLDLNASLRLWDGSLTPLGANVTGPFEISIADAGVIGSLLRWPTLDNFIRHYVDKGIDFSGGTLIDLGSQLNRGGRSVKLKGRDALKLARQLYPFLTARSDGRRRRPGLRGRDHRATAQDRRQQGLHPVPLRPVERLLRALPRSGDGLLLRLLHRLEQRRRAGAARQAGDDLPQAAPEAGRTLPRHRLRLGRSHLPRGEELRRHARMASRCRRSSSPSRKEKIKRLGLEDKVTVELKDYSMMTGEFDKIASIGMYEHIGLKNIPGYMQKMQQLLAEDGLFLNHAIARRAPKQGWFKRRHAPRAARDRQVHLSRRRARRHRPLASSPWSAPASRSRTSRPGACITRARASCGASA